MRHWQRRSAETIFQHPLLSLERQRLAAGDGERREVLVLAAPDWVNVVPLLPDGRVVMVRQWRFGVAGLTLEIPGGVVEDDTTEAAAHRELREETGYRAGQLRLLGTVNPNPAIFANRCLTYLATDLERVAEPAGGVDEEQEVELVPLAELPRLVRSGEVCHALVLAALQLLAVAEPPVDRCG